MNSKDKKRCARCGKRIKKGGIAFHLKAELISHFDGYLQIGNKDSLREIVQEIESKLKENSEEELEHRVYQKFEYLVCAECRDELAQFLDAEDKS
jgi:hypothetical protein